MNSIGGLIKDLPTFLDVIVEVTKTVTVVTTAVGSFFLLRPLPLRWRKMVTLKGEFIELSYLRAIEKLRSHEEKSDLAHPLEQQVYKESIERLIARYLDAKYGYNFTGAFQAFLFCVLWLILCLIVLVDFPSSDLSLLLQIIEFILLLLMLLCGIVVVPIFFALLITDSASIPGSINFRRRKKILKRECAQEVSLSRLQDLLLKNVEFVFVDGTMRSGYQMSSLGLSSGVISLCSESLEDESVGLAKSEWKGVKTGEEHKDLIKQLVQSRLLPRYLGVGEHPQFIVVSEYGISSIEVTKVLQESGFIAHNLGKIENRVIPLKKKIEELLLLRESGLV